MNATTAHPDRSLWPPTKIYKVVQIGPQDMDVVAEQDSTEAEMQEVAYRLVFDMIEFEAGGRKPS